MVRSSALLRGLGLVLAPTALVTGCPGDDASVDTADSSSSSGGEPTSSTTLTTTSVSDTASTTVSTTDTEPSTTTIDPDSSSSTDPTNATTESSSSESSASSSESSSTGADLCGNGVIDAGEDCEGDDLGGMACTDVGYDGGTLGCNAACLFDVFNCEVFVCGNGDIQGDELCDADQVDGNDCEAEGFPLGGELICNDTCDGYDVSGCLTQLCGNGIIEGTETCDGDALGGQSCAGLGYVGGELACAASCANYVSAGCVGGGDQFVYVVNDTSPNSITGYSVDPLGVLTELPGSPFDTAGSSSFDHHPDAIVNCGAFVYAANFNNGTVAGFSVGGDGSLTAVPGSPFATVNALGLACNDDYLFVTNFSFDVGRYAISDDGSLTALGTTAASPSTLGITLDRNANRLFVSGYGSTMNVFDIDGAGDLAASPGSPSFDTGTHHSATINPAGTFLAGEGNNTVHIWSVAANGALTEIPGSPFPDSAGCEVVGLAWAPDGNRLFVGHRGCFPGYVSVFDVADDGSLAEVGGSPFDSGDVSAVALAVDQAGERLFVAHSGGSSTTSVLDIEDDGALVPVAGSPFPNGVGGNHAGIVVRGGGGQACQVPFGAAAYDEALSFADAPLLVGERMPLAWDGVGYWGGSGSGPDDNRLVQYDGTGAVVAYFQPGFDVRSVFTKGDGTPSVFVRQWNDAQIHAQLSPGMFGNDAVLTGGTLDSQSAVVWDDTNDYFLAHYSGTITRWDATGAFVDTVVLDGYGDMGEEEVEPQAGVVAWSCGYFYTYSEQVLSAWDEDGNRVATTTLNGAGTSGSSYYSASIANGLFFVVDNAGGTWRGYDAI